MVDCLKESQQRLSISAFQNRLQIELRPYAREMRWKTMNGAWHHNFNTAKWWVLV